MSKGARGKQDPDIAPEQAAEGEAPEQQPDAEIQALREELEKQQQAAAEAHDRFIRTLADFDNYRKRSQTQMEDTRKFANEELVSNLLPILDNFERALQSVESAQNVEAVREGVQLIYRQLGDALTKIGLKPIEAVGQPFDPNLHEAIMQVEPQGDQQPHEVVEELRRGYQLHDRVVRPTLVKVTSG